MGRKNFFKKIVREVCHTPVKVVKEVCHTPAKVIKELGRADILGVNPSTGKFHVGPIPVGKDLVPVVNMAAAVVLTPIVGAPASAALITAANGGNAEQMARAALVADLRQAIPVVSDAMPSAAAAVAVQVAAHTAVEVAINDQKMVPALVGSALALVPMQGPPEIKIPTAVAVGALEAVVEGDKPLRGGLQKAAPAIVEGVVTTLQRISSDEKERPASFPEEQEEEEQEERSQQQQPALSSSQPKSRGPVVAPLAAATAPLLLEDEGRESPSVAPSADLSLGVSRSDVSLSMWVPDAPHGGSVGVGGVGVFVQNDQAAVGYELDSSDIYPGHGFQVRRNMELYTPSSAHSVSELANHVVREKVGSCISTRQIVNVSAGNQMSDVPLVVSRSDEVHFNNTCVRDAAAVAVVRAGMIVAPEVVLPALAIGKVVSAIAQ